MLFSSLGYTMVRLLFTSLAAILILCGSPTFAAAQWRLTGCDPTSKNLFVRDVMSDIYLWYSAMPAVDPASVATPEEYLEAVRHRPLDDHFSYITARASNRAFFGESQYVGFGLSWTFVGRQLRVLQVFPDSSASEAGLSRGDRVTALAGEPVEDLAISGTLGDVLGPDEIGFSVRVDFIDASGVRRGAHLTKRVVTIPTVSHTRTYDASGRRVGYIFFRNFVEPSFAALDAAFAQLSEARVDDVVLDMRYNGGGLVNVARHLASIIGGVRTRGQVFAEYFHNDKNLHRNEVLRFEDNPNAAGLNRLIVITTPDSASASELVINALRPFIPVVVIGDRTYGKPVGQYQVEFCDKMLAPVSFSLRNANGEGDFFGGIPADCPAPDDIGHALGDPAEASLREALTYAATGACSRATSTLQRLASERRATRATGWQSVLNAY
jgi:carboxyl-terminal processing protease